jgi:hypothetical protein
MLAQTDGIFECLQLRPSNQRRHRTYNFFLFYVFVYTLVNTLTFVFVTPFIENTYWLYIQIMMSSICSLLYLITSFKNPGYLSQDNEVPMFTLLQIS